MASRYVDANVLWIPSWLRSAEVSKSVKIEHVWVSEHRQDMPNHAGFANSSLGNTSGAWGRHVLGYTSIINMFMVFLEFYF